MAVVYNEFAVSVTRILLFLNHSIPRTVLRSDYAGPFLLIVL